MTIPLYKPFIGKNESKAVLRVLKSKKLSRGKEVEAFEKEFSEYVGKKYAVAINSGTSALHLSVRALNWQKGDEVITTPFSYIASSNALLFENVTPVFVDIDPKTLNIDPSKIEEKITHKTRGILIVDIFGLPNEYKKIKKLKDAYGLSILEDACEAIGRPNRDFSAGKLGDVVVYGFHENKQITSGGEGGMIVTNDLKIAEKCRSMRDQGRSLKKDWLKNVILGFNFRMTEIQAALGREQLKLADKILSKRQFIAETYSSLLKELPTLTIPSTKSSGKRSWFLYFIQLNSKQKRDKVYKSLLSLGISSSKNYFPPIYKFPMYKDHRHELPHAEMASETLLALPTFYELSTKEIKKVCRAIKIALK